jgi:hypothetical protein
MATEEVTEDTKATKAATKMVEVWASTMDALLQQWLEQGKAEDRLGMALTSYKLAQLGLMVMRYFQQVGSEFIEGPTEAKAARQAVEQLDEMVRRAMKAAGIGAGEQASQESDPSLN